MKEQWKKLVERFAALSQRERLMISLASLLLVMAVLNALLVDPVALRLKALRGQLDAERTQTAAMQQQMRALEKTPVVDPDAAPRARLAQLNTQLQQVNDTLDRMQQQLVSPDRMPVLLEDLLKKNGQLTLVSLKTLPVSEERVEAGAAPAAGAGAATAQPAEAAVIYRHGVVMKVRGRYLDLMGYLQALEKLPWHMLWGNASLTADAYPQSTLTLTIYTLSLDKVWLTL